MNVFKLSDAFLEEYKGKQPAWGPIGFITYRRTYARPVENENRVEEYWETCRRVVEGCYSIQKVHCKKLRLPWNDNKAQKSAQEMYQLMWEFKFLPPGRGLWMMGTDYLTERNTSAPLYNCSFCSTKDISTGFSDPFCFLMDMSMLGVGVGFDTRGAGTIKIREPFQGTDTHQILDSREGWVDIVRRFLDAYVGKNNLPTIIDSSLVRPYSTPIKGFGGTASGPASLLTLLDNIHTILKPLIGKTITVSAIVDLFNAIGRCVVSGNVRRSAEIAFGNIDDLDFLQLKDPTLYSQQLLDWRWASNNSVLANLGSNYSQAVQYTIANGEPGYFWLENAQNYGRFADGRQEGCDSRVLGTNPCGEISLESFEFCNVPETFPYKHSSFEEYRRTLKMAYLYAKTVTLIPTHDERTNAVQMRNRRIGLSMSGIAQSIQKLGIYEHMRWCDEGYKYLRALDGVYSDWLCVPRSRKLTSVKPSGSVSLLMGATPGIHFPEAEYYYRTMRIASGSDLLAACVKAGYRVELAEGHDTSVVYFPIKEENFWKAKPDLTIWEQLELAAQMQYFWADNQVSVTISFKPEEASQINTALQFYQTRLKSVSFLPLLTEEEYKKRGFEHLPIQPITKEEYEVAVKKLKPLNLRKVTETEGHKKVFCDGDTCELIPQSDR